MNNKRDTSRDIAIIGIAGKFPGANSIAQFWENLVDGKETIKTFDRDDLIKAGLPPELADNKNFIARRGVIDDVEFFDASFFSYSPREAELIDPQQKLFLECSWSAFEDAGYDPMRCTRSVGVFSGCNQNSYQLFHVINSVETLMSVHGMAIYSEKDFLSTRVSYKLNLQGPSMTIQTACSTSLVAVHLACQSLLAMECDMALAGGVSVVFPQVGYMYQDGGVFSPDGHCRSFDQSAAGTLGGDGVGVVLLKRFEDAIKDGDHIYGSILGSAINNDGAQKSSFAAPSSDGQMKAIAEAIAVADINSDTIGYIETHGTATPLGDVVEITALTRAFKKRSIGQNNTCFIGSLKPNIGHLDQAAGIANFIKASLIVKNGIIPPSLHFENPNAEIHFSETPFKVNDTLSKWPDSLLPRRAGVSCFGFGGTNAHVIVEQAPEQKVLTSSRSSHLILISARTQSALDKYTSQMANYFIENNTVCLADVAFVMQTGRTQFDKRCFFVASTVLEAHEILSKKSDKLFSASVGRDNTPLIYFLFSGEKVGNHNMKGMELYYSEPVFRRIFDDAEMLLKNYKINLKEISHTELFMFVISFASASVLLEYGIKPAAIVGFGVGEYAKNCLSGICTFSEAIEQLVARNNSTYTPTYLKEDFSCNPELKNFLSNESCVFIELGSGNFLSQLIKKQSNFSDKNHLIERILNDEQNNSESVSFLMTMGKLWLNGISIDFEKFYACEKRQRLSLPAYPFERKKYFIEPITLGNNLSLTTTPKTEDKNLNSIFDGNNAISSQKKYERPELGNNYVSCSSDFEKKLVAIWQEILGIEKIGIRDDFFDLGGDSISAIQIIAKITENFPIDYQIQDVIENSTIEIMATDIEERLIKKLHSMSDDEAEKLLTM